MMEGDIRKKGTLYHQQQRFGKKWKKVWAEAVAESTHNLSCLKLFEFSKSSAKESKKRAEGKKVILMRDCVKITEGEVEGCPKECGTFSLETIDKKHIFASSTPELHSWITELCKLAFPLNQDECRSQKQDHHQAAHVQENTLYDTTENVQDYLVITVATEAALRCKLYGEYTLTPRSDSLVLKDCKTKKVLLTWPYRSIRKFGEDRPIFYFEAGRRCESGEGSFEFVTNHSEHLFTIFEEAVNNYPKVETSGTRPKEQHSQKWYRPPAQEKHSKKNLTSSLSLNTSNLIDISRNEEVHSAQSSLSNVQDPVYAMINRPKVHFETTKSSKNQQHEEEADQMKLAITKCMDDEAEPVYSEVKSYKRKDDVDNDPYSLTSDLKEFQSIGYNKNPSDFQRLFKDNVNEDQQLDWSMEQLSIGFTPNNYGSEAMNSQVPAYDHDYGDIEESVDFSYPPCPNDTHSSNFEDCQDEGFDTYDNLFWV